MIASIPLWEILFGVSIRQRPEKEVRWFARFGGADFQRRIAKAELLRRKRLS